MPWQQTLKRESRLKFETTVVSRLGEASASEGANAVRLIGLPEARRPDVADDRAGIVSIQQVANGHRDRQRVTAA